MFWFNPEDFYAAMVNKFQSISKWLQTYLKKILHLIWKYHNFGRFKNLNGTLVNMFFTVISFIIWNTVILVGPIQCPFGKGWEIIEGYLLGSFLKLNRPGVAREVLETVFELTWS